MRIPVKTLKDGFSMPVFGIGTWNMGGDMQRDPDNDDERDIAAIRYAIEQGITHIDTAEMYAEGHAEELVAAAMQGIDRSNLLLVSKVSPWNLAHDDVLRSAEASLRRLQTDYLDLYLIHKPNPQIPIAETMRALDRLKTEGLIRHIGVSNFTVERMKTAQACTPNSIVANQVHYNMSVRESEQKGVIAHCQQHDMLAIAWRPVGRIEHLTTAPVMLNLAQKYGKTPVQIAINWLIAQQNVVTLTKTSSSVHLDENLGAVGWTMDDADVERLRHEFPDQIAVSESVPLI
jgi:diketogulonate reductase-like aldo/keto reductase